MKKKTIIKLVNITSIILLFCFVISIVTGYLRYYSYDTLNSAPFYVWVLVDAICYLGLSLLLFIIGMILQKKVIASRAVFWSYIAGLAICGLTAFLLLWNPFRKDAVLLLTDNRFEISGDFVIPEMGSASGDFDGDGKTERYSLTFGPTSGVFTVRFSVYEEG